MYIVPEIQIKTEEDFIFEEPELFINQGYLVRTRTMDLEVDPDYSPTNKAVNSKNKKLVPVQLCSICKSPSITEFNSYTSGSARKSLKSLQRSSSRGKSKGPLQDCWLRWTNACAHSFCSVFNLPTDRFLSVLTSDKNTAFCRDCFSYIWELEFTLKQIDQLQRRLEWNKNQIEGKLRTRFLQNDGAFPGMKNSEFDTDTGLAEMIYRYLPYLSTSVKIESDGSAVIETDIDMIDHEAVVSEDNFSQEHFSQHVTTPVLSHLVEQNNYSNIKSKKRKVSTSARARKKMQKISRPENMAGDKNDKKANLKKPSRTAKDRVKSETIRAGTSKSGHKLEKLYKNVHPSIEEKKRILKLIEEHPDWDISRIQHCENSFKHKSYKGTWKRQIKQYEKVKESAGSVNKCAQCLRGSTKVSVVRNHLNEFHPPRSDFICATCDQAFGSEEDVINHEIQHRVPPDNELTCLQCSKQLPNLESLKIHIWGHELRQFRCTKGSCLKYFSNANYLTKHKCRIRPKNKMCEQCGMAFKNSERLDRHMLSHSNEKMFKCHLCPVSVKYAWSLTLHMKTQHDTTVQNQKQICE